MSKEKIKEVMSDKTFVEGLLKLETPEEVQKAFAGKGATVSIEEIMQLKSLLVKTSQKGGEMSLEDMEEVAGGSPTIWIENGQVMFTPLNQTTIPPQFGIPTLTW